MDIKLPDCLTAAKVKRDVKWYALLDHVRKMVAQDGPSAHVDLTGQGNPVRPGIGSSPRPTSARSETSDPASPPPQVAHPHHGSRPSGSCACIHELACVEKHWATIRSRLRGKGIHSSRQLLSGKTMDQTVLLLPTQMSSNPGWLRPLRRLLSIVDVKALFHTLDPGEGASARGERAAR